MANKAVIRSYAKINLFLDLICKRPDGYHNIETIFQNISLSDLLTIELAPSGTEIVCDHPSVPLDESNLACKAFLKLANTVGYEGGARIRIEKNIPPGSGLGGGSSNAAATLVALNNLLRGGLSENQLGEIAREIGADVPFFISGGLAAAWQIGDRIMRLPPVPESLALIAVPGNLAVSTAEAYGAVEAPDCMGSMPEDFSECSDRLKTCVDALESPRPLVKNEAIRSVLYNGLEEAVLPRYPKIAELKRLFISAGARGVLMSGSGSAVFGLAESLKQAAEIKSFVERDCDCSLHITHTVDHGWELNQ